MKTKLYYNAVVLTQERKDASVFVVENKKFIDVGDTELIAKYKNQNIEMVDLKGNTVIPGFVDAHIHVWKVGSLKTFILDVRTCRSILEIKDAIVNFIKQRPHLPWVLARGFNEANLTDQRLPTKVDLDEIITDKPIFLQRTCAHIAVVNSKALTIAGINPNTNAPQGGKIIKDDNGSPNGILCETAMALASLHFPHFSYQDYAIMIENAIEEMLDYGITSATDPAVTPDLLMAYKTLENQGNLKIRINAVPIILPDGEKTPFEMPTHFSSDFLDVNTVKFFADGGLSGKTAALNRTYLNSTEKGILRLDNYQYNLLAKQAHDLGFIIATHAIGDAAIDVVINCYLKLIKDNPKKISHRIEHLGLPNNNQLKTIADHGFWVVTQPIFITELGANFKKAIDNQYLDQCYPYRRQIDMGVKTAFSSDAPVVKDLRPLAGIKAAVIRKDSNNDILTNAQCISIKEALKAYTINAATANGNDNNVGSICVGKCADFVILNENIIDCNPEKIDKIKILATFVDGVNKLNNDF